MAIKFRKKSLEKLSSPEQLDTLLKITTPSGWVALATVGFCLAVCVAWGVYGRIPTKLSGSGILLNPRGVFVVTATSTGILDSLKVKLGQSIKKGDVVATISHPQDTLEVATLEDKLKELQDANLLMEANEKDSLLLKKREMEEEKRELDLNKRINQSKMKRLDLRIKNQKELVLLGLITQYELSSTQGDRDVAKDSIAKDNSQLISIRNSYEQAKQDSGKKLKDQENAIEQARDDLAEKQAGLKEAQFVSSPYDGVVVGVATVQGTLLEPGTEVISMELVENDDDKILLALQYYPASTGKRIKKGMAAQIAPGTVKVDQFGYLLAKVTSVAEFPATTAQLSAKLQNDELVTQIEKLGTVLEIESVLLKDSKTPSGYKWTSSQGPPYSLQVGTICSVSVIVEEVPPITLVIPMIKKYLLGVGEGRE